MKKYTGTHGYLNTHGYPWSGYPRGYGEGTYIIFIQRSGDMYHTICTHGYPSTSLVQNTLKNRIRDAQIMITWGTIILNTFHV